MKRTVVTKIPEALCVDDYELVFTPTKAISRSIKTAHFTLESLAETIVKKKRLGIASALLARRTLQDVIAEVLLVKDVVGITSLWTPVIQELLSSGCDLLKLKEHYLDRVSNLAKVALLYKEQLSKISCIDRHELFWQAAKFCRQKKSCLFYGYFYLERDRLTFINALSGNNSLLILPCEEKNIFSDNTNSIRWLKNNNWQVQNLLSNSFDTLGKQLQKFYLARQYSSLDSKMECNFTMFCDRVILNNYSNLENEVRGVLTQVKWLLNRKVKPHEIVIVAREERLYGETLLDVAWEYDVPLRAFYDVAFLTTRIGAWLQLLLEIIGELNETDKLSFESFIKLLRHPLARKIDAITWQQIKVNYPQTIAKWQDNGIDLTMLQLPLKASGKLWQEIIKQIVKAFDILSKIEPWAKEIVAYYKFQEALEELFFYTDRVITRSTFISEIQELLNSISIPIQPGRGGVELHSPASLFGSSYKYVFVLGMAEDIFPKAIADDFVLGYSDRKVLERENIKVNTISKFVKKEALAFYFLLGIPLEKIFFSYSQLIAQQPYSLSPYLASFNFKEVPVQDNYSLNEKNNSIPVACIEEVRTIYLRQNKNIPDNLLNYIRQKWQVEKDREQFITNEYNGLVNISLDPQKFTFSASQLTQIGQCPFKWFAARLLKLEELSETKLTLESNVLGSLYHRCLELYLQDIKNAEDLQKLDLEQLKKAFEEAEANLQIPDIPIWETYKQELLNVLKINVTTPSFLPSESEIIEREKYFTARWHGLKIKGIIDRLDRTPQGIKVIDYKTSSSPPLGIKDRANKITIDIQIPLYIDAMAEEYPESSIDAVYYSLSKCKPIRRNKTDPEALADFARQLKQYLSTGNYPIAPDIQFKACKYCQFDLVCRKSPKTVRYS